MKMEGILYQKTGVTISMLALNLMSKNAGDRVQPISAYQEEFGVSRGTIQNAFNYLKETGAIHLKHQGHLGTYIEAIDYAKLQENCMRREMLGIMPLPYSITYEGFATAIYEELKQLNFNMAYARGAAGRIQLVETGVYQFAICSQYAAEYAIKKKSNIEVVFNFGMGSFLSQHVLLLRDKTKDGICDGMRVAYDSDSLDQSKITQNITKGKKVKFVDIRTQNTITALADGVIDAGIWNYEDVIDNNRKDFKIIFLDNSDYNNLFSTAVLVIRKNEDYLKELLKKHIKPDRVLRVLQEVRDGKRMPNY